MKIKHKHTDCFEITDGVGQGDVTSLLFNFVIDYIMGMLQQANILKWLAYADDICLLDEDVDSFISLTDTLNVEAKKWGQ